MKRTLLIIVSIIFSGLSQPVFSKAISQTEILNSGLNGSILSPYWGLPFLGIILSIALFPLLLPDFWSKHYGKVALVWSAIVLTGIGISQGPGISLTTFLSVIFDQFFPFIFLLLAVFTVTGGIAMEGEHDGTPTVNVILLFTGAILSSWLGTAGAAVLLIRPLIKANSWRKFKVHTIIFFIFIVGNIGGSLSPLGNPPLLMGFISKIPFFWPTGKLFGPTALTSILLIVIYFFIDLYYFKKETSRPPSLNKSKILITGGWNLILLIFIIFGVVLSSFDFGTAFILYHVPIPLSELIELLILILVTFISVKITSEEIRIQNNFTWHPIIEVGKLFAAIFICMAPLIAMLRAGANGPMSFIINSLSDIHGQPINGMYYWLSGGLSAFLDSAPAYLVFFNTAAAPASALHLAPHIFMTNVIPTTLVAITAGASFMGAITYIGNAPNMMVKAIAEENNIKMPSFFGYMVWSLLILLPIFLIVQFLFIQ
jgi:Na+/H+ antiporter NhaD/arsenite permease-like protein